MQTSGAVRREIADVYLLFEMSSKNEFRRPGQASKASADLRCAIAHRGTHAAAAVY
jgi:hypothetical protein